MPSRKKPPAGDTHSESPSSPVSGERELIVVAKSEARLRAAPHEVASESGADVASINSILESVGAAIK